MAAIGTSLIHGGAGFTARGKSNIVQSRANLGTVQGWKTHLFWRLEPEVIWCRQGSMKPRQFLSLPLVMAEMQNADMPPLLPKRRKRPAVAPKQPRRRRRIPPELWQDPSLRPPANGLLVENLIPVAHTVMDAKAIVTKGVSLLLEELPVVACRYCSETHIGPVGHNLRTCLGSKSATRNALHDWVKGTVDDILVSLDAYHLADRLAHPVSHEERFDVDRIHAVDELCIQAGVEIPAYPTKRYVEPVQPVTRQKMKDAAWLGPGSPVEFTFYSTDGSYQFREPIKHKTKSRVGKNDVVDAQADDSREFQTHANVVDTQVDNSRQSQTHDNDASEYQIVKNGGPHDAGETQIDDSKELESVENEATENLIVETDRLLIPLMDISGEDNLMIVAQKTLQAWERMRQNCKKLMTKYRVVACGYCPEIHVGPRGHKARACGAFKHQWRDGKHGWQAASVDDLIPPQYVWHLRDRLGPPLENALRRYYGKAPALVELCVQAGLPVPERYKPLMRLDIAIPSVEELQNVI